jgi:hypothetical protein
MTKLNLSDIAKDANLLAVAQRKVRAGHKITRIEKCALMIEASRLQDIALAKMVKV